MTSGVRPGPWQFLREHVPETAGLALLLTLAAGLWFAVQYRTQVTWVEHTLEVQKAVSQLFTAVLETETAQRGFLITGDDIFLEPVENNLAVVPDLISKVERLTSDNPRQSNELLELRTIVNTRLRVLQDRIDQRKSGTFEPNDLKQGRELMDAIRSLLNAMTALENQLLASRIRSAQFAFVATTSTAGLGALLAGLTIFGWVRQQRRSHRELTTVNKKLVQTLADLETGESKIRQMQKMEAVGQLAGGIAHDFNNLLAVIVASLNLLQRRLRRGDTDVQKFVDAAIDGADRAATLTKRLLNFSRQYPLAPEPVKADTLVSSMSELVTSAMGDIKIETILAGGLWWIHVDKSLLESSILNLCINARDAMPEGGKLTIETANTHLDEAYCREYPEATVGQYVLVAVSDTGTGMTPDVAQRALDPFFTTKEVGKGTGLGLSQVHGFVKQSGGHVKIYTEPGQGTAIKLYFPRFFPQGEAQPVQSPEPNAAAAPENQDLVVLVVEDDEHVRSLSVAMVRELGYTVIQADGAMSALRELDAHPEIAVLFTDVVMPEMNGRRLADEALKRRPGLKVLFTTGFTRNAVIHNGALDADVHFVAKPFTLDVLATKLKDALDR
ncbi:MAG TPA: CHASE3 domain-containing protein [Hyphomicrobiaceae bacterium]|nr:CHASE3 domain-containing protein [Hyphomicrobiaceae bacterium]